MVEFFKARTKAYTIIASTALSVMLLLSIVTYAVANDPEDDFEDEIRRGNAKNVILLIGDGMGDSEITMARNYEKGASGKLVLDELPFTGAMTTYSVFETDPSMPDYDPESASTASA